MESSLHDQSLLDQFWHSWALEINPRYGGQSFPFRDTFEWVRAHRQKTYDLETALGPLPSDVLAFFNDPFGATDEQAAAVNARNSREEALINGLFDREARARFDAYAHSRRNDLGAADPP